MSVGFVIVTHGNTGRSLITETEFVLGQRMTKVSAIAFNQSGDMNAGVDEIRSAIENSDSGKGVLVMTDLLGSSPANRVAKLLEDYNAVMVTGVNLAMLISVWNYRKKGLGLVARKAVEAGRRGVKIFQE
jgi:PTS system ascorbate-specific IIA component